MNNQCSCLPGQCRGGQVVGGKLSNGDICKEDFSRQVWFLWTPDEKTVAPWIAGKYQMEWRLRDGHEGSGFAADPSWDEHGFISIARYRWTDPRIVLRNPHTGLLRHWADICQDPEGKLIVAPCEPLKAAELITDPAQIEAAFEQDQRADAEHAGKVKAAIETLERLGYTYEGGELWKPPIGKAPAFAAPDLLDAASGHMRDRAKTYDKPEGERSMGATVEAFNAITGRDLRESEGWLLMTMLKFVRSETRDAPHRDSVEDLIAYSGLYGEARLGGV